MNDSPESDDDPEPHPVRIAFFDEMSCAGCADLDTAVPGRNPGPAEDYRKRQKSAGFFKIPDRGPDYGQQEVDA